MRYSVGADNIEDSEVPKLQPISASRHAALRWKRLPEFSFAKADAAVPVTVAEMPRAALSLPVTTAATLASFIFFSVQLVRARNGLDRGPPLPISAIAARDNSRPSGRRFVRTQRL